MSFTIFTNWAVGVINGYKQKENGLPNGIKYGTIGITTFTSIIKVWGNLNTPAISNIPPGQKLAGLFIIVPFLMASNFCVGHHMGKALRYAEDGPKKSMY